MTPPLGYDQRKSFVARFSNFTRVRVRFVRRPERFRRTIVSATGKRSI